LNEYPSLTVDNSGRVWIVWTGASDGGEAIFARVWRNGIWGTTRKISRNTGNEFRPRIAASGGNRIWVVWGARRDGNWDIYLRGFENDDWNDEIRLTRSREMEINPVISAGKKGDLAVAWEVIEANKTRIDMKYFDGKKWLPPFTVSDLNFDSYRPWAAADKNGDIWIAWDSYYQSNYDVFLRSLRGGKLGEIIRVTRHPAFDQAPSLCFDGRGLLWISWHSNRVPGTEKTGIQYWFYLRAFDGRDFYEPPGFPEQMDLEKNGTDQGFQFPFVISDKRGSIWIFGRPSQNFTVQYYHENKWSPMVYLSGEGWGGRGQYVYADAGPDGNIYTVRRDIGGIFFQYLYDFAGEYRKPVLRKLKRAGKNLNFNLKVRSKYDAYLINEEGKEKLSSAVGEIIPERDYKKFILERNSEIYYPYFGDIHQHSSLSDGMGTIDAVYARSRDVYNLDFAALTDHEYFVGNEIMNSEWEYIKTLGKLFNEPGRFVTFSAYEWTSPRLPKGYGHKNVFFLNPDAKMYSFSDSTGKTTELLFNNLTKDSAIAVPHHTGWTGTDWYNHNPEIQPVFEIVSDHGAFEHMGNEPITHRGGMPGMFLQDGLASGLIFGFIGSSDGHGLLWHHGISRKRDPWAGGLTVVFSKELSRKGIFEGLLSRRAYATSGERIMLNFSINGHWMGEIFESSQYPEIEVLVRGTGKIRYVTLIRNNADLLKFGGDSFGGQWARFTYIDEEISYGRWYYYIRVVQENGEMAWSSPIWIDYLKRDK
ncbi:MAG: DUF3604 domain-containing protein, partial [Fidelibacterota bacterium]